MVLINHSILGADRGTVPHPMWASHPVICTLVGVP